MVQNLSVGSKDVKKLTGPCTENAHLIIESLFTCNAQYLTETNKFPTHLNFVSLSI